MSKHHRQAANSFSSLVGPGMGSTGNPAASGHMEAPPANVATPPNGPAKKRGGHVMAKCPKCGAALKITGASPIASTPGAGGGEPDADDMAY